MSKRAFYDSNIGRYRDQGGRFTRPPKSFEKTGRDSAGRFIPRKPHIKPKEKPTQFESLADKTPLEMIPYMDLETEIPPPRMKSRAGALNRYGLLVDEHDYSGQEDPYPEAGSQTLREHALHLSQKEKSITEYKFAYSGKKKDVQKRKIRQIETVYLVYSESRGYHYMALDWQKSKKRARTPKGWAKELRKEKHDVLNEKILPETEWRYIDLVYFREKK